MPAKYKNDSPTLGLAAAALSELTAYHTNTLKPFEAVLLVLI